MTRVFRYDHSSERFLSEAFVGGLTSDGGKYRSTGITAFTDAAAGGGLQPITA
jgi:hypothetical protein